MPASYCAIFIDATFLASRAPGSSLGSNRVAKAMFAIGRDGSGKNVVLDSNINSLNFDVLTTTNGGSYTSDPLSPTIARTGAEASTATQQVAISVVTEHTISAGNSSVLATFDIQVLGSMTGFAIS